MRRSRHRLALALALALTALTAAPAALAGGPSRGQTPYLSEPPNPNGKRALLIGDSNFFGPLGHVLYRELVLRGYRVAMVGKPGSGLAHPQYFNWFKTASGLLDRWQPDLVIAIFGGNDGQPITRLDRDDAPRVSFRDVPHWNAAYEKRVRELASLLRGTSREVFILSPTNRREPARSKVVRIKALQADALAGMPGVHAVDMFPFSSDETGGYLRTGLDASGRVVSYRKPDGIHLTRDGGEVVGKRLMTYLVAAYGI